VTPDVGVESNSGLPRRADAVSSTNFVFPNDTNHHGTMFGGRVLQLMDQTGAIAAARFAHTTVVTAAMEAVSFQHPIREGMIIETVARVVFTGRTSMIVRVDVYADHQLTGERKRATTGYLTMVALDAAGKPTPVPRLLIETEDERADEEAAERVRQAAKQRAESSRFEVRGSK
jgi:acyl-CoA hydrolase